MSETMNKRPLTRLNYEIEEAEAEQTRLDADRASIGRMVSKASRRLKYLRLAGWVRKPTKDFEFWPIVLMSAGSGVIAVVAFILTHLVFDSISIALLGLLAGLAGGGGLIYILLYKPSDALLPATIAEADGHLRLLQARLKEKVERITDTKNRLKLLLAERRDLIASGELQKAALLQRNWKAMRDEEWEDYLVEVCRTLGAKVERTGRAGDQGVDLIVQFGDRRIAVQAKGYHHAVNNAAIQQAYAGMAHYGCSNCAAITNSRFTPGAKALAQSTGCSLIDENDFPAFVMGKFEL